MRFWVSQMLSLLSNTSTLIAPLGAVYSFARGLGDRSETSIAVIHDQVLTAAP
jgi:hypothetical protein